MWYQEAFARLFGDSFRTFEFQLSQHMNNLETLLNAETFTRGIPIALSVIKVQNHDESNVLANERRHSEQPESINDTYVLEKDDSNVIPDSSNIFVNQKHDELAKKSLLTRSQFEGQLKEKTKVISDLKIPYDTSDPANNLPPMGEETENLEKEVESKLDKDTVKPYNYTYQNSLYETFKPPSKTYLDQLETR
ncbi:hypothetical protein Tco_1350152 [Tanacetum coccineum]